MLLDLPIRTRGRQATVTISTVRSLTVSDVEILNATPDGVRRPERTIKALRERHHRLAQYLAMGLSEGECMVATGYAQSTISILKMDPAFQDLVKFYAKQEHEEFAERQDLTVGLSKDALLELRDRLENNPESLSPTFLLEMFKVTADRTGMGPTSSATHQHNHTFDMAGRMDRARERLRQRTIDITPEPESPDASEE